VGAAVTSAARAASPAVVVVVVVAVAAGGGGWLGDWGGAGALRDVDVEEEAEDAAAVPVAVAPGSGPSGRSRSHGEEGGRFFSRSSAVSSPSAALSRAGRVATTSTTRAKAVKKICIYGVGWDGWTDGTLRV
jgi:hypothetical protein